MISTKESAPQLATSEFSEVEFVARDTEVFDDVGNDASGHVAGVPGEGDDASGAKGIGIMPVAAGVAQVFAADSAETTLQLPTVERGVFTHRSGGQHEFISEGSRDGSACLQQGFQMGFGRFLKTEDGLAPVTAMRMTTGQQAGFGDPHAILIAPRLDFRDRNYHSRRRLNLVGDSLNAVAAAPPNNPTIH